jgi:tetratricopeptide (TPR) repeat protein
MQAPEYVVQRRPQFSSDAQESLFEQAKYAEGLARCQELLAELRLRDPRHADVGHLLYECSRFQRKSGDLDSAIATIHETLAFDLSTGGEVSWNTVRSLSNLAYLNHCLGHYELGEQLIQRGLAALNQLPVEEQDEHYVLLLNLAAIHSSRGQLRNAELQLLEALRLVGRAYWWVDISCVCQELACVYIQQGRLVAAKRTMVKAIRLLEGAEKCRLDEFSLGRMHYRLGRLHQRMNEPAEAHHCFAAALAVFQKIQPLDNHRIQWENACRERLGDLQEALVTMP